MPACRLFAGGIVVVAWLCLGGCNRAAVRIPGASRSFPATSTRYVAQTTYPYAVVVAMPADARSDHFGERVAGTRWTGCSTDPFWETDVRTLIRDRLAAELAESKLFARVSQGSPADGDLVIHTEIRALCAQAIGFIYLRVAGISALTITVERGGRPLFDHPFERVVTDADKEYTGSQVAFIEQAMAVTTADSLRELMRDVLTRLQQAAPSWSETANSTAAGDGRDSWSEAFRDRA